MEPVEINAGTYYLRNFRADDRLDDRPRLLEAFADPELRRYVPQYEITTVEQAGSYIATRHQEWELDQRYTWVIAEPTTGRLLGEVGLKNILPGPGVAEIAVWTHPDARGRGIAQTGVRTVTRFGFGALDLRRVDYVCDDDNAASAAVAAGSGFTADGPTTSLAGVPSQRWTMTAE